MKRLFNIYRTWKAKRIIAQQAQTKIDDVAIPLTGEEIRARLVELEIL